MNRAIGGLLIAILCLGCSTRLLPYDLDVPAQAMRVVGTPDPTDGRARFREIFCALLARENGFETGPAGCEKLLHRLADEAPEADPPAPPPAHDTRYRVLIAPGLFGECFGADSTPFAGRATERLRSRGYRVLPLVTSGRSSPDHNAAQIAAAIRALEPGPDDRLLLIGYSKGAVDLLHFLRSHPDLAARVDAVASVAGAINGSPIADRLAPRYERWIAKRESEACAPGDGGAMDSLRTPVRLEWLAANPLPTHPPLYSVVAFTDEPNTARVLRPTWREIARSDPRNDGQLLFFDQLIPGATLLGYANADHFAVAIPFDDHDRPSAQVMARGHAPFPRGVLLEAIVLYVVERATARPGSE